MIFGKGMSNSGKLKTCVASQNDPGSRESVKAPFKISLCNYPVQKQLSAGLAAAAPWLHETSVRQMARIFKLDKTRLNDCWSKEMVQGG